MAGIVDVIRKYTRPFYYYVLGIILVVIFILAAYYVYNQFYPSENFDVANTGEGRDREEGVVVYFFNADWCPHCTKAKPEWNSFAQTNDGKVVNGYKVSCIDINCTDEEDAKTAEYINKFGIEGYPSVKMVKGGKTIEFDSRISTSSLNSFLTTMLEE